MLTVRCISSSWWGSSSSSSSSSLNSQATLLIAEQVIVQRSNREEFSVRPIMIKIPFTRSHVKCICTSTCSLCKCRRSKLKGTRLCKCICSTYTCISGKKLYLPLSSFNLLVFNLIYAFFDSPYFDSDSSCIYASCNTRSLRDAPETQRGESSLKRTMKRGTWLSS